MSALTALFGWLMTGLGKKVVGYGVAALAVVAFVSGFAMRQQSIGAQKVVERSAKAGKAKNEKARKARRRARRSGSAKRIPCRDC